jgi:hypothetical protein
MPGECLPPIAAQRALPASVVCVVQQRGAAVISQYSGTKKQSRAQLQFLRAMVLAIESYAIDAIARRSR